MAARAPLKYRIVLRGRKGFTQLRYATTFEIWYGRRRVVPPTSFSNRHKKVAQRTTYLQNLVKRIEKARLTILAERRAKRTKKKLTQELAVAKKTQQRSISSAKPLSDRQRQFIERSEEIEETRPQFENTVAIKPVEARKAAIIDTLLIPVIPKGRDFTKQIIDKIIEPTNGSGVYHVAIMDMNLSKHSFIRMDADNFREAYRQAALAFLPHIYHYFERTKKSSSKYILRIKFLHKWDREGQFQDHAISWLRTEITTDAELLALFRKTFEQMFGGQEFGPTTKLMKRTNYLAGDGHIFLTGTSLEAANSN